LVSTQIKINYTTRKNSPFSPLGVVQLLSGLFEESCNTLPPGDRPVFKLFGITGLAQKK
jgi:hypothetical protein